MSNSKNGKNVILVTTAIESTWGEDEEILFLGEWCKLYSRRSVWSERNHRTLPYHWDDRLQLHKDYTRLQNIYEQLLVELSEVLNKLHGVNYSVRYWRIVAGYWLWHYTVIIYDRWTSLQKAIQSGDISYTITKELSASALASPDFGTFLNNSFDDLWNLHIISKMINGWTNIATKSLKTDKVICETPGEALADIKKPQQIRLNKRLAMMKAALKMKVKPYISKVLSIASKNDQLFFYPYAISLWKDRCMYSPTRLLPRYRSAPQLDKVNMYDHAVRNFQLSGTDAADLFGQIVRELLPEQIPMSLIEGFKKNHSDIESLGWPNEPKVVFTNSAHFGDLAFKLYAADKTEKGALLITADHGGSCRHRVNGGEAYQYQISDFSLSWGSECPETKNIIPVGMLSKTNTMSKTDPDGVAFMLEGAMPRYAFDIRSMPVAGQMNEYFQEQFRFIESLPYSIQKKLMVRLYPYDYGWSQYDRFNDKFPHVAINTDKKGNLAHLIHKSRIFISTYHASNFLEPLANNIPTLMFWNQNYWELRDDAIPFYDCLRQVGIFHETPESAATKLAEIWDDVPGWWNQADVQEARDYFCQRFARKINNPTNALKMVLDRVIHNKYEIM